MAKQHTLLRALLYAAASLFLAAALEGIGQTVFPGLATWEFHIAAILQGGLLVFLISLGLRRCEQIKQEKLFDPFIKSLPEIACVFDSGGRFRNWNHKFEAVLGYSSQELCSITATDVVAKDQRETIQQVITSAFKAGLGEVESVLVAKDSTRIPCLLTGVRISLRGEPCILGIAVDLRKLKQAEESLLRLGSIVECSEDAIIGRNRDGLITSWNRAAEKMYGYTMAEAVGRDLSFLLPSDRPSEMSTMLERATSGRPIERFETQRLTKAGSLLDVSLSISPIRDAAGRNTGISTIARDITLRKGNEEQLKLQSAALEAAANGIVITDRQGTIVWVNGAFTTITGYSKEEVLGKNPRFLKSGEQPGSYYTNLWSTISSGKVWQGEIVNRRKNGTVYTEEMTITPVMQSPGNETDSYFIAIKQDITERKRAEKALVFKTALLEAQAETTIDGILVVDESNHIVLTNKQFGIHFAIPDELLSTQDDQIVLEHVLTQVEAPGTFLERVEYLYSHRDEKSRDEFRLKNGKVFDRYSAPLVDSQNCYRGRIWYFRDITDSKLAEERIQFLAYYDALTRLPNRTLLQDRLATAIANARRQKHKVAILFLDLDRFKDINDSLGHSVGDLLLQEVAERLKGWGREQDTVARLGGDEFLIMLPQVRDIPDAAVAAERLMDAMATPFIVQEHTLHISCSLGISIFPEHGGDSETLIKNADAAMYRAKEGGRNNFRLFAADMNAQVLERLSLENNLRLALGKRELFLAYQPQMDVATGKIPGLEALLRWQHPELGLVPPDKFIRIAENSGLIVPIGEWVLRAACSQARKWQDEGLPGVKMAVNVSAVQFRDEGFCTLIKRVLDETGLAPQYLELELTESILLANADVMLSVVQELKAMGLALAIDDFGTGYSSFAYLRQFPASKLKIDRSFIRDVALNPDDAAITAAIISMAKHLRLKVIAEGVETEAQMSFLRTHQCDEIQGYYFSAPLTANDAAHALRGTATRTLSFHHEAGQSRSEPNVEWSL